MTDKNEKHDNHDNHEQKKKEAAERLMNGLSCVREDFIVESAGRSMEPAQTTSRKWVRLSGVLATASILIIGGLLWWILSDRAEKDPATRDTAGTGDISSEEIITEEGSAPEGSTEKISEAGKPTERTDTTEAPSGDVPSLAAVTAYSFDQMLELSAHVDEDALIRAWGEPFRTQYQRIWKLEQGGKTKYVEAFVQNGQVGSLNNSVSMYAVVAAKTNGVTYCFLNWNDYIIDRSRLCILPKADVYGNLIPCEVGDRICLECNGIVMESYPAQINPPYGAVSQGRVSEDEMKKIEEEISGLDTI